MIPTKKSGGSLCLSECNPVVIETSLPGLNTASDQVRHTTKRYAPRQSKVLRSSGTLQPCGNIRGPVHPSENDTTFPVEKAPYGCWYQSHDWVRTCLVASSSKSLFLRLAVSVPAGTFVRRAGSGTAIGLRSLRPPSPIALKVAAIVHQSPPPRRTHPTDSMWTGIGCLFLSLFDSDILN